MEATDILAHYMPHSSDEVCPSSNQDYRHLPLHHENDLKVNVEEWENMSVEEMQQLVASALLWHDVPHKDEFEVLDQQHQKWQECFIPATSNQTSYGNSKPEGIHPLIFHHQPFDYCLLSLQGIDTTSPATANSVLTLDSHHAVEFPGSQQQFNEAGAGPAWMDMATGVANANLMAEDASADARSGPTPSMDSDTETALEQAERGRCELTEEERAGFFDYLTSIQSIPFCSVDGCRCKFCPDRQFFRRHDLVLHVRTMHLHERRYNCKECGSRFKRKSHLMSHVRALHQPPRAFSCVYCAKVYSSDSSKRKHIRVAHQTTIYE